MKKFVIGVLVLLLLGSVVGQLLAPSVPQISMQIMEEVKDGRILRMSVLVPDSVENGEGNLRSIGEQIFAITRESYVRLVRVDIFTNVNAFKVRKRIMKDESNTVADKTDYDAHFLGIYTRNATNGYHGISVLKRDGNTLPREIRLEP